MRALRRRFCVAVLYIDGVSLLAVRGVLLLVVAQVVWCKWLLRLRQGLVYRIVYHR